MPNQGHHANVTGNSAENVIRCILIAGALTWLKMHIDGKKLIAIFDINEFLNWTNKLEKKERKPVIATGRQEITFDNFRGACA